MKAPVWSFSFLSTYWSCPRQAQHKYVLKDLPRVESEAMTWGIRVHEAMEKRIHDKQPLPEDMGKWEPLVAPFAAPALQARAEMKVGMDVNGTLCGFFDKQVWGRGVLDVLVVHGERAFIGDWKTGKRREDPTELGIFAMFVKIMHPQVTRITGRYVWLQDSAIGDEHDLSNTSAPMWAKVWNATYEIETLVERGEPWPARKNGLCSKWCDVMSCEHNGRRR
jgi:hypothetical protein